MEGSRRGEGLLVCGGDRAPGMDLHHRLGGEGISMGFHACESILVATGHLVVSLSMGGLSLGATLTSLGPEGRGDVLGWFKAVLGVGFHFYVYAQTWSVIGFFILQNKAKYVSFKV